MIFIVGPTAVGKSEIAFQLAKKIKGEIISCDSMQVYHGMKIMNQCPPAKWTNLVPHHLVGILEPSAEYSAAQFRKNSLALIERIIKKGKTPIIAGGSGLYAKALLDGLFPSPPKDPSLRKRLEEEARLKGPKILHSRLKKVDPDAAAKIHPNDLRRIIRALEVYYLTGSSISGHKKKTEGGVSSKYDTRIFGLIKPRDALYERVNKRVDKMFEEGLIKEVKNLAKKKLSMTASAALGYKEISGCLKGEYSLEQAKSLLKRNTRKLVKRQLTWFRADKRIEWLEVEGHRVEFVVEAIMSMLSFLRKQESIEKRR